MTEIQCHRDEAHLQPMQQKRRKKHYLRVEDSSLSFFFLAALRWNRLSPCSLCSGPWWSR